MSTREAIDLYRLFESGQLSPAITQKLEQIAALNLDVGHNTQTEPLLPVHRHDAGSRWEDGVTPRADRHEHVADWGRWCTHWYSQAFFFADVARKLPSDAEVAERYGARLVWNANTRVTLITEPEAHGIGRAYRMNNSWTAAESDHCLNGVLMQARVLDLLRRLVGDKYWPGVLFRVPDLYGIDLDSEQTPVALPGEISREIGGRDPDDSPEWFRLVRFAADLKHFVVRQCFRKLGWNIKVWTEPTWAAQPGDPIICGWRTASDSELPAKTYLDAVKADMSGRSLITRPVIFATHSVKRYSNGAFAFLPPERLTADLDEVRRLGVDGPLFWWNAAFTKAGEPLPGYAAAMECLERFFSNWRTQKMDEAIKLLIDKTIQEEGLAHWPEAKAKIVAALQANPELSTALIGEAVEARKPTA